MRFLPSLLGSRPETKASPFGSNVEAKAVFNDYVGALMATGGGSGLHGRAKPWSVEQAVTVAYERVVWAYRCIEAISSPGSRLTGFVTARDTKDGKADYGDPLLRVINGRANPLETGQQLRKRLIAQVLLSKRGAFLERSENLGGRLARVDLLPPGRTEIIPGDGGELISHYKVTDIYGRIRRVEPEKVLWFRNPHPLDPYSGVTPLESAGLSIELDYFARLFNATFLQNDGRPSGIIAVSGAAGESAMADEELDRIEAKFGKGPLEAGKLTALTGRITYVEPGARPRDVQYGTLSQTAKSEILGAFGVPLSKLGDASDRTYANADAEDDHFWLTDPMPGMLDLISSGFASELDAEDMLAWDLEDQPAVQRAKAARRTEARSEVEAGLRSIISYAGMAGLEDVESTPTTRALWMQQGRTPVPASDEDAAALGLSQPAPGGDTGAPAPGDAQQPAAVEAGPARPALPAGRTSAQIVADAQAAAGQTEVKAAPAPAPRRRPRVSVVRPGLAGARQHVTNTASVEALATDLEAALGDVAERHVNRAVARLKSPKARRGTRHFTAQYDVDTRVGTKALDTPRAVDQDLWARESQDAARPILTAAAQQAAQDAVTNLADDDADANDRSAIVEAVVAVIVAAGLASVAEAAGKQAARLADALNVADQTGKALDQILDIGRSFVAKVRSWARGSATQVALAAIEGSENDALSQLIERGVIEAKLVRRTWLTRQDPNVRPTHAAVHGQTVGAGVPFVVGSALLGYPHDPSGPPSETFGCRCYVLVTVRAPDRVSILA